MTCTAVELDRPELRSFESALSMSSRLAMDDWFSFSNRQSITSTLPLRNSGLSLIKFIPSLEGMVDMRFDMEWLLAMRLATLWLVIMLETLWLLIMLETLWLLIMFDIDGLDMRFEIDELEVIPLRVTLMDLSIPFTMGCISEMDDIFCASLVFSAEVRF